MESKKNNLFQVVTWFNNDQNVSELISQCNKQCLDILYLLPKPATIPNRREIAEIIEKQRFKALSVKYNSLFPADTLLKIPRPAFLETIIEYLPPIGLTSSELDKLPIPKVLKLNHAGNIIQSTLRCRWCSSKVFTRFTCYLVDHFEDDTTKFCRLNRSDRMMITDVCCSLQCCILSLIQSCKDVVRINYFYSVLYKIYIPSGIDKYWDSKDSSLADLEEEQQQISPIELRSVNFSFTQGEIEQILLTSPYNPNPTFISDTSSQPIYEEDNI